jgi:hypothetical protein
MQLDIGASLLQTTDAQPVVCAPSLLAETEQQSAMPTPEAPIDKVTLLKDCIAREVDDQTEKGISGDTLPVCSSSAAEPYVAQTTGQASMFYGRAVQLAPKPLRFR